MISQPTHAGALEEDFHRRFRRSWREVCGLTPTRKRRRRRSPAEFLQHVRAGDCTAQGRRRHSPGPFARFLQYALLLHPGSLSLRSSGRARRCSKQMFSRFMEGRDPTEFTLRGKSHLHRARRDVRERFSSWPNRQTCRSGKSSPKHFARPEVKAQLAKEMEGVTEPERRTFLMANLVCEQLAFRLFEKFVQQISNGNIVESMQALSGIAPILVLLSPYIYAFHSQAPSRTLASRRFSCR